MTEQTDSAQIAPGLSRRGRARAIASWEAEQRREVEEGLALLDARRAAERRERRIKRLTELWPLWVGLLLGLLGPEISFLAASIGPWCVTLIYPFVELAGRPEIQVGPITHMLPAVMLYTQFPIEGLLARFILKRRIRLLSVVWQVSLFHFLGLMELWMLSGGAARLFTRS